MTEAFDLWLNHSTNNYNNYVHLVPTFKYIPGLVVKSTLSCTPNPFIICTSCFNADSIYNYTGLYNNYYTFSTNFQILIYLV